MTERQTDQVGINSLVNIDKIIHSPARLTILIYLYVGSFTTVLFFIFIFCWIPFLIDAYDKGNRRRCAWGCLWMLVFLILSGELYWPF